MKHVNGLYVTLVLMQFTVLTNATILDNQYAGITMFLCTGVFIVGTAFYVSEKNRDKSRKP
ncbi:hypothetical protein [Lentibacillus sediminis]|uniref:hypothetical protein n=1 Tax=Lentibacillus sediminis TaxID=1940529 RepID=UPI000C1BDC82|nr:hypothetical protein [Lentibacillus sediminis]